MSPTHAHPAPPPICPKCSPEVHPIEPKRLWWQNRVLYQKYMEWHVHRYICARKAKYVMTTDHWCSSSQCLQLLMFALAHADLWVSMISTEPCFLRCLTAQLNADFKNPMQINHHFATRNNTAKLLKHRKAHAIRCHMLRTMQNHEKPLKLRIKGSHHNFQRESLI